MADQEIERNPKLAAELADEEHDHAGGGRFNRRLLMTVSVLAVVVGRSRRHPFSRREGDERRHAAGGR